MPRIRVTMLPAGKRKPEVVEWEYEGDGCEEDLLRNARGLASRIADKGLMSPSAPGPTTIYPAQRIEKVEVLE